MRGKACLALASCVLVLCVSATAAGAKWTAWQKNTWHLSRAGVLQADFLMPRNRNHPGEFFIAINGPTAVRSCKLVLRGKTQRPRQIGFNGPDIADVYFYWPKMRRAAPATATCTVRSSVSSVTVVLSPKGTIRLRHR
jgi:hypothetical protein